jgi:hypothetical protein
LKRQAGLAAIVLRNFRPLPRLDLSHGGRKNPPPDLWQIDKEKRMDSTAIHDYARRLVGAHGDKAELEAAQRAASCERQGDKGRAADWRKIQAAIKEMRGPRVS